MAFEKLFDASNATPFKFEKKGATLEGYYMGSFDYEGDYGPTKKHIFNTAAGAVVLFGQRNLMQQLPAAKVGAMTRITYTSDRDSGKGKAPMKLFSIEQDRGNKVEVIGVDLTPTDTVDEDAGSFSALDTEETDADDYESAIDEAPPARTVAPKRAAVAPDAERQRKVQELLSRGRAKTT